MIEVHQTEDFSQWLGGLRDRQARVRIQLRIDRLQLVNPGDVRPVGQGVSELRIDYGRGYRVYYVHRGPNCAVLLVGGDKSTQNADVKKAKELADQL